MDDANFIKDDKKWVLVYLGKKRHCEWNYYWISGKFIWAQSYFHLYHILRYPSSHIRAKSKGQSSNGAYLKTIAFIKGSDWLLIYLRISFVEGSNWNSQYGVRKGISSFFQPTFFYLRICHLGTIFFTFLYFLGNQTFSKFGEWCRDWPHTFNLLA